MLYRFVRLTAVGALSLAFLGVTFLWLRSYRISEGWFFEWQGGYSVEDYTFVGISVWSAKGGMNVGTYCGPDDDDSDGCSASFFIVEEPVYPMSFTRPLVYHSRQATITYPQTADYGRPLTMWDRWGFGYSANGFPPYGRKWYRLRIVFPYWFAVLVTGFWPALWIRRKLFGTRKERRRRRLGLCFRCGYDLRTSPERCPKCGTQWKAGDLVSTGNRLLLNWVG